jgi:zinc protease
MPKRCCSIWNLHTSPPEDKLRREKDLAIPPIRNRNKNASQVASRAFNQLIYGENAPITAETTEAGISGITRDDLIAWHKKYWGANDAILVVTGDFKKAEMLQKLETRLGQWRMAEKAVPPIPKVFEYPCVKPMGTDPVFVRDFSSDWV